MGVSLAVASVIVFVAALAAWLWAARTLRRKGRKAHGVSDRQLLGPDTEADGLPRARARILGLATGAGRRRLRLAAENLHELRDRPDTGSRT